MSPETRLRAEIDRMADQQGIPAEQRPMFHAAMSRGLWAQAYLLVENLRDVGRRLIATVTRR